MHKNNALDFKNITVVGLGLIGSSLCKAIKDNNIPANIFGSDINLDTLEYAKENNIIDEPCINIDDAIVNSELIVLCTPTYEIDNVLPSISKFFDTDKVITDTFSIKDPVLNFLESNKMLEVKNFVMSHPIAGNENSGAESSLSNLYSGTNTIVCSLSNTENSSILSVKNLWEAIGSNVIDLDVKIHDKVLGLSSHFPHALSYLLANLIDEYRHSNELFINTQSLDSMLRISKSDPKLWSSIIHENKEIISILLNNYSDKLDTLVNIINSKHVSDLENFLTNDKSKK